MSAAAASSATQSGAPPGPPVRPGTFSAASAPPPDYQRKQMISLATGEVISSTVVSGVGGPAMQAPTSGAGGTLPAWGSRAVKTIAAIEFGMMSGADMQRAASLQVVTRDLYKMGTRIPAPFGCLDRRLGCSGKDDVCGTCGRRQADCPGHFGVVRLELPVFHIGFLRSTIDVLQNICKQCARVLLGPDERRVFLKAMGPGGSHNPGAQADSLRKARLRKRIAEACKKVTLCPWCHALNGQVKKVPGAQAFRIIHDRYNRAKGDAPAESRQAFISALEDAAGLSPELRPHVRRAVEDLTPLRVLHLFKAIPEEDYDLLWADPDRGAPADMVLTHLPVPPVTIRPSVPMDAGGGSNEDDITVKLQEIIHINTALRLALSKGTSWKTVQENWDFLQVVVAGLFNGDLPGLPAAMKPKRPIRGLSQRLKGKQGRFRGNLSGKRVDFSARTVISPDPNLPLFCVGVPVLIARNLTYPEKVTSRNLALMKQLVINGPDVHPGANYIYWSSGVISKLSFVADRARMAEALSVGDIVERHLQDGDPVLFNRQPSLHKMSIMCHRARVQPWRTFRFNECCCTPYNADFDGDEMNLHLPQTSEARAEAALLMDVRENLITPRSGEPLIAATQDFLTAAYLLTRRDAFLTRDEFAQAVATLGDAAEHIDLPPPTILKPVPLWTGKQVFNLLLRPNAGIALPLSFETKGRSWKGPSKAYGSFPCMCEEDGYVTFRDGQLMSGILDKATLGGGSKKGLVFMLARDVAPSVAARALHRLTKMTSRWLMNWGFSIGIEDVAPAPDLVVTKHEMIRDEYGKCDAKIREFKDGNLALQAGCNEEQSLEAVLNGLLSNLRDSLGNLCMSRLPPLNSARVMATCGSKGSVLNIAQMVASVGQQNVGGARIAEGFVDRTLPAFKAKAKEPAAKGFVANSFYSGLTATEFFFHTMGGREGLVDTAVKTAETGYMQRRMMKALEDVSVQYDNTVRTSNGDVVQFRYGDDGLDPAYMEGNGRPADLGRLLLNAQSAAAEAEQAALANLAAAPPASREALVSALGAIVEPTLTPAAVKAMAAELASPAALPVPGLAELVRRNDVAGARFLADLQGFLTDTVAGTLEKRLRDAGAPADAEVGVFDPLALVAPLPRGGRRAHALAPEQELPALLHHTARVTRSQLLATLEGALRKYRRARIQPGEAVGAVAAHSLGEPATQMTLKTFHFAGVASMNVTLGVPRIKEIMNASRAISTPIIEAALENGGVEMAARSTKARLEKTTLGDVARCIREMYQPDGAYLEVVIDLDALQALQLDISATSIAEEIMKHPKLKLKRENVAVRSRDVIEVRPPKREAASRIRAKRQRAKEAEKEQERLAAMDMGGGAGGRGGSSGAGAASSSSSSSSGGAGGAGGAASSSAADDDDEPLGGGGGAGSDAESDYGSAGGASSGSDDDEEDSRWATSAAAAPRRTGASEFFLHPPKREGDIYFGLQALKTSLPGVIIQGIPTVNRAVITREEAPKPGAKPKTNKAGVPYKTYPEGELKLLVEGYDLLRVMGTPGVDAQRTKSNHIIEVAETLGIEAARDMIQQELARTYGSYGIGIDERHLRLLADVMTYRGEVLGITRFGIAKMKDSVLMLASFEKTPDHLFDAAVHCRTDVCKGVSESIIVGTPIPLGTGLFKLLHDHSMTKPGGGAGATGAGAGGAAAAAAAAAGSGEAGAANAAEVAAARAALRAATASTLLGEATTTSAAAAALSA